MKTLLRHNLIWILIILIFAVGIATIVVSTSQFIKSTNHTFKGDAENIDYPGISLTHLQSHQFQKYIEDLISNKLRLRNFFIRINSQIYYSFFKKSFAENNQIIIGKKNQLFEMGYITSYCHKQDSAPSNEAELIIWANQIKQLSDFFESRGKTFIYLITPSKAEYMPSAIPNRFHCNNIGIKRHITLINKLLTERHVRHVDGATLMVEASKKYQLPMFPKGGIHWNWLGSTLGAEAIIDAIIQDKHVYIHPFQFTYRMDKIDRKETDDDLLSMIKLLKPDLSYLVPQMTYHQTPSIHQPIKAAIIGGSFNENLIQVFLKNKTFTQIDLYFYLKTKKIFTLNNKTPKITKITLNAENLNSILTSDVIILEENSSLTISPHGKQFYTTMSSRKMPKAFVRDPSINLSITQLLK